jgi:hypothetical protein
MEPEQRDPVDDEDHQPEQDPQTMTFRAGPRKALRGAGIQPIRKNPHHAAQQRRALSVV